jgi:protein SCO1/2
MVDGLALDPQRSGELIAMLREDHPVYEQRGTTTIVRMRGWILLALAQAGVTDDSLIFVLEELDTGVDAYLVAAAARALRSYNQPAAALVPFVMRAFNTVRYHDDPVSFDGYGDYADSSNFTTPTRELIKTLAWLGAHAREVLPELRSLRTQGLSKKIKDEIDLAIKAIERDGPAVAAKDCCEFRGSLRDTLFWALGSRRPTETIKAVVFEDHKGELITFRDFFRDRPSIVAFFYTRCDNPLKCSLTIAKLARIQKLLVEKGVADRIQTAAITYDPGFDSARRLQTYGKDRGLELSSQHRMLRATEGMDFLSRHFNLGVNFIESLVSRHRLELYILDAQGRIAASFERIHWEEQQVVEKAIEVLNEKVADQTPAVQEQIATKDKRARTAGVMGAIASLGVAFFPKCPICWAGYLSMLGIAGLDQIPYSPWLQPVFVGMIILNLLSVWLRSRLTGRMIGFYLVSVGAAAIMVSRIGHGSKAAGLAGFALTLAGSLLSTLRSAGPRFPFQGMEQPILPATCPIETNRESY